MRLTSASFALFTAVLLTLYYRIPKRGQWILLLAASCGFYICAGAGHLVFLLVTTLTTYATAVAMERDRENHRQEKGAGKRRSRLLLVACLTVNFGILAVCKVRLTAGGLLLPLGISFYMFQSMGYAVDVYRGTAKAETNPFKLALFISFFPQLVQGPVSQFNRLAPQLFAPHEYDEKEITFGLQRMLWGYFKKLVIADRIAVAVAALKGPEYTGAAFLVLTVFYAVQIYADFTGGIDIALGLSQALGIRLPENFLRPFFSKNIAEYWRRWHITLGAWMKEYLFYPICVSRPMRMLSKAARAKCGNFGKRIPVYAASAATWFVTGIWHGITPNFVLWGMLNCFVIVVSEELTPLYRRFHNRFQLKAKRWYGCFEMLRMFFLMNLIRACDLFPDVGDYFARMGSLLTNFHAPVLWDGTLLQLGLTGLDYIILAAGVVVMFAVSLLQEKRGSVRELLWGRPGLRRVLSFGLFLVVLLMGRYGVGYDAGSFIYNQF